MRDFALVPCVLKEGDGECHLIYLTDATRGIVIIEVIVRTGNVLEYKLLMEAVGGVEEAISVDTVDGRTVMATFNMWTKWVVAEIAVDLSRRTWEIV